MIPLDFSDPGPVPVERTPAGTGSRSRVETWRYTGSAGDTVAADAAVPEQPWGVLIVGHGMGTDRTAPYIADAARVWATTGLAVVAADAPLHGERGSGGSPDLAEIGHPGTLVQAVRDHRRLRSIVAADPHLGGLPVAYLGFSMGTVMGVPFVATDGRFEAAVFTIGGSTRVLMEELQPAMLPIVEPVLALTDPTVYAPQVAAPVLQLNASRDDYFSRDSALALFEAFPEPKQHAFFSGTHSVWDDGDAQYRRIYDFVATHLR